jgi:aminopeptidase N
LTFYDKGAWALALLRDQLGEDAFKTGTLNYLRKYQYSSATVAEYLSEMSAASGQDLSAFRSEWLDGTDFSMEQARQYLSDQSPVLKSFFAMQHEIRTSNAPNERVLQKYWATNESLQLRERSIRLYFKSLSTDFIRKIIRSGDLKMRQAVVQSTTRISKELQADYELLLSDPSYLTVEQALYLLWVHFPEKRADYLKKTEGVIGLPDRNVKSIWLLLASLTSDYASKSERMGYREQLANFTSPEHPFEMRQRAFILLSEIQGMTDQNLKDLINASVHPQYAFRSFARQLLDTFLKIPKEKERLRSLLDGLKPSELRYIEKKLTIE